MAINILLILPISDEPERVFLRTRRTVTWDKGQIEIEIIKLKECFKYWKRNGILDKFFKSY
jgi:hypothetical protein